MPSTNDVGETREEAAARLLRVLEDRSRRRRGVAAPPIAPDAEQLVFDLACGREIKTSQR